MSEFSLAQAFTKEHHEIDDCLEEYLSAADADESLGGSEPLRRALEALRRHIYLEEELVFGHLSGAQLMMPLMVMYKQHGQLWDLMDRIQTEPSTQDAVSVRSMVAELLSLLEAHNSKEEPIIYPRMDLELSQSEQQMLTRFMDGGSVPQGYRCRDASGL